MEANLKQLANSPPDAARQNRGSAPIPGFDSESGAWRRSADKKPSRLPKKIDKTDQKQNPRTMIASTRFPSLRSKSGCSSTISRNLQVTAQILSMLS